MAFRDGDNFCRSTSEYVISRVAPVAKNYIYTYGKSSNHVFVRQGIFCKSKKIRGINTYKYSSGYKAGNHKEAIKREPWFYKVGVFLANSMKEQSMNQNAYHVADSNWIGKFTFPRNFSSVDFVIKPGNNGFSNFK